jgi:hypothetical protein
MGINLSRHVKPSKYFTGADLVGETWTLTIIAVTEEHLGRSGEEKVVLAFEEDKRRLTLNASRLKALIAAFGKDTDDWIGNSVELFGEQTDLGPGVRIRPTGRPRRDPKTLKSAPSGGGGGSFGSPGAMGGAIDDEIPF